MGLYCVGTEPELVTEENWFFRLSRHAYRLHDLITGADRLTAAFPNTVTVHPQSEYRSASLRNSGLMRITC
ncbi:hypothetical protein [Streptomyces viridochromogenes]|uniref:Uncharacterized protein n=1 Tax=Streptomyces viridochromogenes Tue57 TaxID=1160705 RepID=L8PMJ0_STRVR|nr:hypothetical protein [Streptomyces viridochromogenes]ELS57199.1 hypothetical protein STVIR_1844 [Streptomyces viridochromogenes Tue57]